MLGDAWQAFLSDRLAQQRAAGLWRERPTLERPMRQRDFASNDYLGLACDPRLIEAQARGARRFGAGAGASHLVSGHLAPNHELEERLAELTGRPRALLFSTGYMANLGTLQTLGDRHTQLYQDRLNHASLLDGAALAGARSRRFHHCDLDDLDRLLARAPDGDRRLVVSDGVFSMDGDIADIDGLVATCQRHGAWLMVDDAHGLGVLGKRGDGCVGQRYGTAQVPVLIGTLGKALGSAGAFVAGDEPLIEALIQFARPYIYTTAQPPGVASATLRALDILATEPEHRVRLHDNIHYFRVGAADHGLPLLPSTTPIQPLLLGTNARVMAWRDVLVQRNFLVGAIREPTVPHGQARLRLTLSARHTLDEIDALLDCLGELAKHAPPEVREAVSP
ncbi:8-amino-7-oxononanoate synthase [Litchfieldella qijiaojingensis]|uniref:8-amino-7-oxononanoate synthase n=1 Tax=Litchfieldella qijiaojingensis TaxID=980347 RepID=A0ABQ2YS81_9GAMM|nr:8-amino-7-oxononanoate synthase [Halomonas qijiaojingensis]GGX90936.1 8-amino-7-oxononanoate synthase [Halomonas qijiaojingensis]